MVCSVPPPLSYCLSANLANPSLAFVYSSILSRLSPVAAVARLAWQIDSILDARLADNSMDPLPEAGFSLIFLVVAIRIDLKWAWHVYTHIHTQHMVTLESKRKPKTVDK